MVEYRENQLILIHEKINKMLLEISKNPSARNFLRLNEYKTIEKSILTQDTWPFDSKSISAAFFAIFLPILLMIVEKIWSIG